MYFYTSDLHLNHAKIIEYCNRPFKDVEEMNKTIISNWNARVRAEDTVFILGDLGFFKDGKVAHYFIKQLNGKKILIAGNHDLFLRKKDFNDTDFLEVKAIKNVKDPFVGKTIVCCHYPMAVWDCQNYGNLHFYGHVHNNTARNHPILYNIEGAYNVGTDLYNFFPVTAEEIISAKQK